MNSKFTERQLLYYGSRFLLRNDYRIWIIKYGYHTSFQEENRKSVNSIHDITVI